MEQSYRGDHVEICGGDVIFQFEYDRGRIGLGPRFYLREYENQTLLNQQCRFFKRNWNSSWNDGRTEDFVETVVPIDCYLADLTAADLLDAFRRMFIQDIMQL